MRRLWALPEAPRVVAERRIDVRRSKMTVENRKQPLPTRRDFISLGIGAFVVGAIPFAARGRTRLVRRTLPVMGTFGEIAVVHRDDEYAQGAIDAAFLELARVESALTWFRPDSEIGRANRLAFSAPQGVSTETSRVLEASLRWAGVTDGAFDPCLGRAVELWDLGNRTQPPASAQVQRFARRGLFQALEVGKSQGRDVVVFHEEDMGIDLGGIGKGYGVDRAVETLRTWGIQSALVNVGGDLYALGGSEDGDPWKVGVRDPDDPGGLVTTLTLTDRAVATSGDYHQFFDHGGKRYHHLLDPMTGAPSQSSLRSVTIAAESCMDADAGATTAFVTGVEKVQSVMARVAPGMEVLHTA
ncbi:MAG: FAD:protein FMN transferase [Gemmatimonadetes bacterium]|nr:FAD:protein FMN transferase [Gemmatimonadota bacterium]NNM06160.1 FAD:protein FMN transferase [Gemmatimonadota bacterium]